MSEKELLENILTAQILILSKQIKQTKPLNKNEGFFHPKTDIDAAISLIQDKGHEILSKLQNNPY